MSANRLQEGANRPTAERTNKQTTPLAALRANPAGADQNLPGDRIIGPAPSGSHAAGRVAARRAPARPGQLGARPAGFVRTPIRLGKSQAGRQQVAASSSGLGRRRAAANKANNGQTRTPAAAASCSGPHEGARRRAGRPESGRAGEPESQPTPTRDLCRGMRNAPNCRASAPRTPAKVQTAIVLANDADWLPYCELETIDWRARWPDLGRIIHSLAHASALPDRFRARQSAACARQPGAN